MTQKTLRTLIISLLVGVVVALLGKEGYTMRSHRYQYNSYEKWGLEGAEIINFKDVEDGQILEFDKGQKYLIVGDREDLQHHALLLEMLSDEEHYEGTNYMTLQTCKEDILGREFCDIGLVALRSHLVKATQPNEVVDSIECLLIDPYERQEHDARCETMRLDHNFIKTTKTSTSLRWKEKNNRKLLINTARPTHPLPTKLSIKKL